MERHDQQEAAQPGAQTSEQKRRMLSELEQSLAELRSSLQKDEQSDSGQQGGGGGEEPAAEGEPQQAHGEAEQGQEGQEGQAEGASQEQGGEGRGESEEGQEQEQAQEEGEGEPGQTFELFDGSAGSKEGWKLVGSGELFHKGEELHLRMGNDRGLAYFGGRRFSDFRLKVRYRLAKPDAPISAVVRFRNPEEPVPDREDPEKKHHYDNPAYVAAHTGFEVRLGSGLGGEPGTLVGIGVGEGANEQRHPQPGELKAEDFNELEVEVHGEELVVRLNGAETARYANSDEWRGKPASENAQAGFIGLLLGEEPRARRGQSGPETRPPVGGPSVPGMGAAKRAGHAAAGAVGRIAGAGGAGDLVVQRVEVGVWGPAPETHEAEQRRARKDLAALHEEVKATLARLKAKDKGIDGLLKQSYGYAVVPTVGRASLVVGGARGYGEVFERGKPLGFTRLTQLTIGLQVGGQAFSQLILFGTKESLEAFKSSPVAFSGNLSAIFIKGATGMANFKDVTAHAYSRGGMLLEASLGGQKYRYMKEDEAIQALANDRANQGAKARLKQAGNAAKSFAGMISGKAKGFLQKLGESGDGQQPQEKQQRESQ
ncbi:MAG: DUF1080 domain-containing protein [Myxococcales bacterium]